MYLYGQDKFWSKKGLGTAQKVMRAALNCFYLFVFIFCRVKLRLASSQIGPINVSAYDGYAAASDLLTRSYL